jgi:hypothetical protein
VRGLTPEPVVAPLFLLLVQLFRWTHCLRICHFRRAPTLPPPPTPFRKGAPISNARDMCEWASHARDCKCYCLVERDARELLHTSQSRQTVKYGHVSYENWNQEWLCWRGSVAIYPTQVGWVEWLPEPSDNKIWLWVLRDSEPRMIVLARTSSNLPNQQTQCSLVHVYRHTERISVYILQTIRGHQTDWCRGNALCLY